MDLIQKKDIAHIVGEVVVFASLGFYVYSSNAALRNHIGELRSALDSQRVVINTHEQAIKQLTDIVADLQRQVMSVTSPGISSVGVLQSKSVAKTKTKPTVEFVKTKEKEVESREKEVGIQQRTILPVEIKESVKRVFERTSIEELSGNGDDDEINEDMDAELVDELEDLS